VSLLGGGAGPTRGTGNSNTAYLVFATCCQQHWVCNYYIYHQCCKSRWLCYFL